MAEKEIVTVRFRIAVKAFIVKNNKLFLIKREPKDPQSPGVWEIPGGRIELGEDPILGLMREIREETGLYIDVVYPLSVRHFEREDGQIITMIIFLCKPKDDFIQMSYEHTNYEWTDFKDIEKKITKFFHKEVRIFKNLGLNKVLGVINASEQT
jgi:8-oxo-dGTP diphosphatase